MGMRKRFREIQRSIPKEKPLQSSTSPSYPFPTPEGSGAVPCRGTDCQGTGPRLTLHIHADGLDGRHSHPVLRLAVVAAALRAGDALDPQRLVEHGRLLELVRRAASSLGPPHLGGRVTALGLA